MKKLFLICMFALVFGNAAASKKTLSIEPGMTKQEVVGFGQCSYTTIWFRKAVVVGMTSRRGGSVAGCGLGSHEVDWNQMPKSTP